MSSRPTRRDASHERILDVAARTVRRNGFAGVGVADVMKQAGLTHGGFYAHFESREALLAQAVERAGRDTAAALDRRTKKGAARGASDFRALVESYLSNAHLGGVEGGCAIAALASEMPRQTPALQAASAARVRGLVERVRRALPQGAAASEAAVVAATLVGSLQLARAVGTPARGRALLAAARRSLLARYDVPSEPRDHER